MRDRVRSGRNDVRSTMAGNRWRGVAGPGPRRRQFATPEHQKTLTLCHRPGLGW